MVEVPYYHRKGDRIVCDICPVHCKLHEGQVGVCGGREVNDNVLVASNYGRVVAMHMDPIEKKPLYHVAPGKTILSVGPNGCNMNCRWCQNCDISQGRVRTEYVTPEAMAGMACNRGSVGIAYTYTEPLIWFEYLRDTMPLVRKAGGINVLVTNGYIEKEPLEELLPWIDAANIDLKFSEAGLYKKYSGAHMEAVLHTITRMHEAGVHVELTHLVVTGLVDNEDHFSRLVNWVAELDSSIPLHISRYGPRYQWEKPPTSEAFLQFAYSHAKKKLDYVYVGNIYLAGTSDTFCPNCGATFIERSGYQVRIDELDGNCCKRCGNEIPVMIL